MNYTHIFWDFNGTILDDVQTGIDCVNILLKKRGLKTIPDKEFYKEVFGFPIIDYYARLGFDFEKESYHEVAVEWVELYMENVKRAGMNPGVKDVIEKIKMLGIPQYILSATEQNMLKTQLDMLGISDYFEEVTGLDNIHAGSKTGLGRMFAERIKPEKALVIGDTSHDYETALAMNADCVLFTGGHMKRSTLEECGCNLFDSFDGDFIDRIFADGTF